MSIQPKRLLVGSIEYFHGLCADCCTKKSNISYRLVMVPITVNIWLPEKFGLSGH